MVRKEEEEVEEEAEEEKEAEEGDNIYPKNTKEDEGDHTQDVNNDQGNTSQEITTTLVVLEKDNLAQSKSDNEQQINTDGKPDNASTSPR